VTSEIAQGRILGNSSALTVGALALAAGSGLAGLYNKYKDKIPSSSYASRPSYYSGPSYSSSYPSYSTGYPSYSSGNPSYSSGNPSYSSGYPSSPTTVYRPSHSRPSYTSRPAYRPAVVRPTTYHKPSPPSSFPAVVRPTTYHKPSPPTSVPAPVQQSSIQNPLYQFNGTHFVLANGPQSRSLLLADGPQSRKLSNYLTGTAGLLGGAYLYNKYQEHKNRPSNYNNHHYPSSHYDSGYKYHPSEPHYGGYPGSYIGHPQPSGEYQGYKRPGYAYVG